jgi:IS30 family transposase
MNASRSFSVNRIPLFTLVAGIGVTIGFLVPVAFEQRLTALPPHLRRTMTFDNGKGFAEHEALAVATGMKIYFAQPYCSWQRGTNENTNGLVREFLPKGTDLTAYCHHEVRPSNPH